MEGSSSIEVEITAGALEKSKLLLSFAVTPELLSQIIQTKAMINLES